MPIPFRTPELEDLGLAAHLRLIPYEQGGGYDGALFVINALGEPIEFCYSRIETPRTVLWGRTALRRRASSELAAAVLRVCSSSPILLLARAEETDPELFGEDIRTPIKTGRVASSLATVAMNAGDVAEEDLGTSDLQIVWTDGPPADESSERVLFARLVAAGLLTEPFERIEAGLA
jgi:hypothetical protein